MTPLAVVFLSLLGFQHPPLIASEVETADREVRAVIQTYYRFFNERNPKGMSEGLFHLPWIYLDPQGARLFESREETAKLFEESLSSIVPRGWDHSDFPEPNVCVLSLGAATVSGTFFRYKKDGSVLSEHGVSYVLGRTPDGWRVTALSSHPPGRAVVCSE
jgi:hypothetical protein